MWRVILVGLHLAVLLSSSASGQANIPAAEEAPAAIAPNTEPPPATGSPDGTSELVQPTPRDANVPVNKPPIPEYQRRSGQRAGGPANDLNDGRPPERLPGGSVTGAISERELYHGNYCGRGSRGGGLLPPVDDLDAACMRHDTCYDRAGYPSCDCDRALQREAVRVADSSSYSRELRTRAGAVAEAASGMSCRNP